MLKNTIVASLVSAFMAGTQAASIEYAVPGSAPANAGVIDALPIGFSWVGIHPSLITAST